MEFSFFAFGRLLAHNLHHQLRPLLQLHIPSRSGQDRVVFAFGSSIPELQARYVVNPVLLVVRALMLPCVVLE